MDVDTAQEGEREVVESPLDSRGRNNLLETTFLARTMAHFVLLGWRTELNRSRVKLKVK